jgi:tetratricopeptide (TPR) repeat protein
VSYYRRAIALGLPDSVLPQVAVQLGSSLRNLGQHEAAVQTLREGVECFPDHRALKAFLALALHSAGKPAEALALMIRMTTDAPAFYEQYQRALRYYADTLVD